MIHISKTDVLHHYNLINLMGAFRPIISFKARKINHIVLIWMLIISFSSCALLTLFTIQVQYRNFQNEATLFREQYLAAQKKLLQEEVEQAVEYTSYNSQKSRDRLKEDIKNRVYQAWNTASYLYNQKAPLASQSEIAQLIREALRPVRFNNSRGYYFIVSLAGIEELYPTNPEFEGSLQYSFVKLFKPLNWLIGTGEFLGNVEEELKKETLEWLSRIRFSQSNNIFTCILIT